MGRAIKIVLATGGTGGHLYPAQALASDLEADGIASSFIGSGLGSSPFFDRTRFDFQDVAGKSLKGNKLTALFAIAKGTLQSLLALRRLKPQLLVGFGGYCSFPVQLAAVILRIPIVLFEPNRIPGKVNRFFARLSVGALVPFPAGTIGLKCREYPISMPIWKGASAKILQKKRGLSLVAGKKTLLVFGGSQGSSSINRVVPYGVPATFQVVHITGNKGALAEVKKIYKQRGIRATVLDYYTPLADIYRVASLTIARAGALSAFELMAFKVPGILIPYRYSADGHQLANGRFLEKQVGGFVCLTEDQLSPEKIAQLLATFKTGARRKSIESYAKRNSFPSVARVIKEQILRQR